MWWAAGADVLVAGSAVFKGATRSAYAANIAALRDSANAGLTSIAA
jgi:ribulose-phosphate 3-epimerase